MAAKKGEEIKVFITSRDNSHCGECGSELHRGAWITLEEDKGALCLSCADLDHLEFLPSGDAALTRRSKKYAPLWAVVLKWSRARKRYERQGLLVTEAALERAEQECLKDADVRERRNARQAEIRAEQDQAYIRQFAAMIRERYPRLPRGREKAIAVHACRKYSGRIGRTAAAKNLSVEAVDLAVIAHIRHAETPYDQLLMQGFGRSEARREVESEVGAMLDTWRG